MAIGPGCSPRHGTLTNLDPERELSTTLQQAVVATPATVARGRPWVMPPDGDG